MFTEDQIKEFQTPGRRTSDVLHAIGKELAAQYPESNFSFGYIGNVSPNNQQDDRAWYFFTTTLIRGLWGFENAKFGGQSTAQLDSLLEALQTPRFDKWLKRIVAAKGRMIL